jgi:hypothetical protein
MAMRAAAAPRSLPTRSPWAGEAWIDPIEELALLVKRNPSVKAAGAQLCDDASAQHPRSFAAVAGIVLIDDTRLEAHADGPTIAIARRRAAHAVLEQLIAEHRAIADPLIGRRYKLAKRARRRRERAAAAAA